MAALPENIATAADYEALAKQRLPAEIWRYLQSGTALERTLADNRASFSSYTLMPRMLADVAGGHTRLRLFDQELEHPLLLGPVAYQRLFHPDGEQGSLAAADAQGGLAVLSSLSSQPFATAMAGSERNHWFQLYWQGSRERTLRLLERALAAGCGAVVLTADAPVKQASLQLPPGIGAVNLEAAAAVPPLQSGQSEVFDGWMRQAPSWDDLAWLRSRVEVPLLLKGVLHPDDAEQAVACGCDGVVVSNHGGRVLDGAPASLAMLPAIVGALNGRAPVLFDSGLRNGRDVFVALALGATAVMLGRPYIWGLSTAGAMGVAHVLRLFRDELEMTMALTGCRTLADITPQRLGPKA